jgi:hypothetical protein
VAIRVVMWFQLRIWYREMPWFHRWWFAFRLLDMSYEGHVLASYPVLKGHVHLARGRMDYREFERRLEDSARGCQSMRLFWEVVERTLIASSGLSE